MYRAIIISGHLISMCISAVVPQFEDVGTQQQTSVVQEAMTMKNPNYSARHAQNNQHILPYSYYYSNIHPEYTNNGHGATNNNKEYAVQSGYEGLLVSSTMLPRPKNTQWSVVNVASSLLPLSSRLILYGSRAGSFLLHITLLVLLGGVFTTAICTLTPLCDITFSGFGIDKNQVKEQVTQLARTYITPENLNTATVLVTKAIDNYAAMQPEDNNGTQNTMGVMPDNAKI